MPDVGRCWNVPGKLVSNWGTCSIVAGFPQSRMLASALRFIFGILGTADRTRKWKSANLSEKIPLPTLCTLAAVPWLVKRSNLAVLCLPHCALALRVRGIKWLMASVWDRLRSAKIVSIRQKQNFDQPDRAHGKVNLLARRQAVLANVFRAHVTVEAWQSLMLVPDDTNS